MEKKKFVWLCVLCLLIVFVLANAGFVYGAGDNAEKQAEKNFVDKFKELVEAMRGGTLTSEQVKNLTRDELEQALDKGLINEAQRKELIDEMVLYQYLKNKVLDYSDKGRAYFKSQLGWVRVGERGTKWPFLRSIHFEYLPFIILLYLFLVAFYPFSIQVYIKGKNSGNKVSFMDMFKPEIERVSAYEYWRKAGATSSFDAFWYALEKYFFSLSNLIIYTLAMVVLFILYGIPILNTFLKIITLEIIGVHFIWRALIIGVVISFFPVFLASWVEREKKRKVDKEKLLEQYIVEKAKIEVS